MAIKLEIRRIVVLTSFTDSFETVTIYIFYQHLTYRNFKSILQMQEM